MQYNIFGEVEREFLNTNLKLKIERLIDYGKAFKGLLTKAQAII